jgi:hypothetical protein
MPKIDTRTFQQLLEGNKTVASLYTPEWYVNVETDVGVGLLRIFTHMQEEILSRLNRVPEKNFVAFLDMLGIKLIPAQPAKVPVTFLLAGGTPGGVFVPAGMQVATAETEEREALTFETTNSFFASSATIEEIYSTDPGRDVILSHLDDLKAKRELKIFDEDKENLQEHILYLGHDELFNLKSVTTIKLEFTLSADSEGSVKDLANLTWEYEDDDEGLNKFEVSTDNINKGIIILKKLEDKQLKKKKINGKESYWIHCRKEQITGQSFVISKIKIMDLSPSEDIKPDLGFYNFIPLDLTQDFYPFGKQPRLFDTFYIASREAFSKKNASIVIEFTIAAEADVKPNNVELSWEYWNGTLWRPLEGIDAGVDFSSTRHILFNCPEDLKEVEVNGEKNYWIRVRLVSGNYGKEEFKPERSYLFSHDDRDGKLENELNNAIEEAAIPNIRKIFQTNEFPLSEEIRVTKENNDKWVIIDEEKNKTYLIRKEDEKLKIYGEIVWVISPSFNPPCGSIGIRYSFEQNNDEIYLQHCLTCNNREYRDYTQESKGSTDVFKPFIPLPEKRPTLYLGFKEAFRKGNISIFFSLVEKSYPVGSGPEIKWTYWSTAPNISEDMRNFEVVTLISTEGIGIGTELLFEESIDGKTVTENAVVESYSDTEIELDRNLDYRYTRAARIFKRAYLEVSDNTEYLTKSGTVLLAHGHRS